MQNRYQAYLNALRTPFKKITRLEFLQPDDSVAFCVGNNYKSGYNSRYDTRALIQGGSLQVSLQNGLRRRATVQIAAVDDSFSFSVNNLWYGRRIRLLMGLELPDGSAFLLPQGVFYLDNPQKTEKPGKRDFQYTLLDKWSHLDGSLFGRLPVSYTIKANTNIFTNMETVLQFSRQSMFQATQDRFQMLDNQTPVFTDYYFNLPKIPYEYVLPDGTTKQELILPYYTAFDTTIPIGGTAADILLDLNRNIVGWIGYDQTGTLRVEESQDDITDANKPVLWSFSKNDISFFGYSETYLNKDVVNDVIVVGEGLNDKPVFGRATNYDTASDTNVNIIGLKTYTENRGEYWNADQCISMADFLLKRKTILQKSVSIECSQMFHLMENRLVAIQRPDKSGYPVENHLIRSFTIPIGETGQMTINATSVNDMSITTKTSSDIDAQGG